MLPGPRTPRSDLLAALTVTALLAPASVAYAQVAGIPPQLRLVARSELGDVSMFSDTQAAVEAFLELPTAPAQPTPTDLPAAGW